MNSPPILEDDKSRRWRTVALVVIPLLLATNLGSSGPGIMCGVGGNVLDVTTGGVQDNASARQIIEDGGIPDPEAITVEGMLSEHTIPFDVPEDAGLLFGTTNLSVHQPFDGFMPLVTLQIGFGTTIDADSFERGPLNLCLAIDRSGSMDDPADAAESATKWDAALIAVDRLLAQLDGRDQISVVTFNDKAVNRLEAASGNDIVAVKSALEGIEPKGSTDLRRAMQLAYAIVARNSGAGRADRIVVFTDAKPTAGSLVASDIVAGMETFAEAGIGTTIFGVGVDFGNELAGEISRVRGGNFLFLSDFDRIVTVFDEEFEYLMTPIAYDLTLTATIPYTFDVHDVHGVPDADAAGHVFELVLPTLFLSNRGGGGAVFVRLRPGGLIDYAQENRVADLTVEYTLPDGSVVIDLLTADLPPLTLDENGDYFHDDHARRANLLLNTALTLRAAAEDMASVSQWGSFNYEGRATAIDRLTRFLDYFDGMAAGLVDRIEESSRALSEERALVEQLLRNIQGW